MSFRLTFRQKIQTLLCRFGFRHDWSEIKWDQGTLYRPGFFTRICRCCHRIEGEEMERLAYGRQCKVWVILDAGLYSTDEGRVH